MDPIVLVFLVPSLLLFTGIAVWAIARHKQSSAAFRYARQKLGLRPSRFSRNSLSGRLDGHRVSVGVVRRGYGKSSKLYTHHRVCFARPLRLRLKITKQGFLSSMAKLFGAQDIEVGDRAFDAKAMIKGRRPRGVRRFLTARRRFRIMQLLRSCPRAVLKDHGIDVEERGVPSSGRDLVNKVRSLVRIVKGIEGKREQKDRLRDGLAAQEAGELEAARAAYQEADEPELAGQVEYLAGDYEAAEKSFAQAEDRHPGEEGIVRARAAARCRTGSRKPRQTVPRAAPRKEEVVEEPPASPADTEAVPEAAFVCEELFGEGRGSWDAAELFEERYEDRDVRWSGLLKRVEEYHHDLVFGEGPGVRAVFMVHQMESGLALTTECYAVVALPAESPGKLRDAVGERFELQGRLVRCDALMRNIYIAQGKVQPRPAA